LPYKIVKQGSLYFVINTKTGKRKNKKGYRSKKEAQELLAALKINVEDA